jgi:hypothetical protein
VISQLGKAEESSCLSLEELPSTTFLSRKLGHYGWLLKSKTLLHP